MQSNLTCKWIFSNLEGDPHSCQANGGAINRKLAAANSNFLRGFCRSMFDLPLLTMHQLHIIARAAENLGLIKH
jgi:hypothetical protein